MGDLKEDFGRIERKQVYREMRCISRKMYEKIGRKILSGEENIGSSINLSRNGKVISLTLDVIMSLCGG